MRKFELSLIIPEGVQYSNWQSVEKDILEELISKEWILDCPDSCGATLNDVLPEEQLTILACNLGTKDSFSGLREILQQQMGMVDTKSLLAFLGKLTIVGNGECPFCGYPDCVDVEPTVQWDYDKYENTANRWETPAARKCLNCEFMWSIED